MEIVLFIIITLSIILKIFLPKFKGYLGEKSVAIILSFLPSDKYYVIHDVLVKSGDRTTQIDHIVVSIYGIFVIETKNYKGWITGFDNSEYWTKNVFGNKYIFYNPIKQNKSHIKNLEKQLQVGDDKYVSLITFNANANLKKVSTESSGIYVVGYKQLKKFMKKQTDKPDILIDEEIENIYQQLLPGTKLSDEEKQEHVNRIKQQYKK